MKPIQTLAFTLLLWAAASCNAQSTTQLADPETFKTTLTADNNSILLDVRTPKEYNSGHIENALNLDFRHPAFTDSVLALNKNKNYFVYCLSGGRSREAANLMRSNGFNVVELKGGIMAWQNANLPVIGIDTSVDKLSQADFNKLITGEKVLVDFYAPWCSPCLKMKPMLDELTAAYAGKVKVVRLNIDENKHLTKLLNVTNIPLFKLYTNGTETWSHQGIIEKDELEKVMQ